MHIGMPERNGFMKTERVIAALLAALITALLCTVGAFVEGESFDGVSVEDRTKAYTFNAQGYELNYRIYYSPAYSSHENDDPAMLILYFHGDGGAGSDNASQLHADGLIERLLSDAAEKCYTEIPYIIVAPQCPEGESFAGEDGAVMGAVCELAAELEATEIILDQYIVAGVGSGATAAYAYAVENTNKVRRCLAVGGECDAKSTALAISAGVDVFAFAEKNNESLSKLQNSVGDADGRLSAVYLGNTFEECLAAVLTYVEPSADEWLISDAFFDRSFGISLICNSDGGSGDAPITARYGASVDFVINANPGYIISKVTVNGSEQSVDIFEKAEGEDNKYVFRMTNITSNQSVAVELQRYTNATSSGAFIDKLMRRFAIAAAVLAAGALCALAVSYAYVYRERKTK